METPIESAALTPTPASQWKGKVKVEGVDLELPSGNVALVRQLSPQAFISSGIIPDPLNAIITKAINSKRGLPPKAMDDIAKDPKQLASAFELFDRVLVYVVVEPRVMMPPTCSICGQYANTDQHQPDHPDLGDHLYVEGPRDPNILYADQVELQDKIFIFQWCLGGAKQLEQFRDQLASSMASVSNEQDVQHPSKSTA